MVYRQIAESRKKSKTFITMSKRLASAAALEQRLAAVNGEEWDSGSEEEEELDEEEK